MKLPPGVENLDRVAPTLGSSGEQNPPICFAVHPARQYGPTPYHIDTKMGYLIGGWSAFVGVLCIGFGACTNAPPRTDPEDFFAKVEQTAVERVVVTELEAVDSLLLSDYDVFSPRRIEVDNQWIYVSDAGTGNVIAIAKEDYGSYRFIGHGIGEGPGEVKGSPDFDVSGGYLVWETNPYRLSRFTTAGVFVEDITIDHDPWKLELTEDNRVLTFDHRSTDFLFRVMHADGTVMQQVGKVHDALENPGPGRTLRYAGSMEYSNGHLYFAGYSESLIKKYALDGTLVFSVSTIDNHPSEINYVETVGATSVVMGYSPAALYSSLGITVYGNYCLIQPASDDDGVTLRYLDVYDATTGEYVESYGVSIPSRAYTVDDEYIIMLQLGVNPKTGDRETYVKFFDNVLRGR